MSSDWTRLLSGGTPSTSYGKQVPMSGNAMVRGAMPYLAPTRTSNWRTQDAPLPGRPYSQSGKPEFRPTRFWEAPQRLAGATGEVTKGVGLGVEQALKGTPLEPIGGIVGGVVGGVGGAIGEVAKGIAGAQALPILNPTGVGMQAAWAMASPEERKAMAQDINEDPEGFLSSDSARHIWERMADNGQVPYLLRDMGPSATIGDQFMQTLSIFGLGERAIQRTVAGGDRLGNLLEEDRSKWSPELTELVESYEAGSLTPDQVRDRLVMDANAGYTSDFWTNLALSVILDPANLTLVTGIAGKVGALSKVSRAVKFRSALTAGLAEDEADNLIRGIVNNIPDDEWAKAERAGQGVTLASGERVLQQNRLLLDAAKKQGVGQEALAKVQSEMTKAQEFATYFEAMEPAHAYAVKLLDPLSQIGRRGTRPVQDVWLASETTRASGYAYGATTTSNMRRLFSSIGKGDVFDRAFGSFVAQEGVAFQADEAAHAIAQTRRVPDEVPTKVILDTIGSTHDRSFGRRLEVFIARRKRTFLATERGQNREAVLATAREEAATRMQKMTGRSAEESTAMVAKWGEDELSLFDAVHYGFEAQEFVRVQKAAKEALDATVSRAKGKVSARTQSAVERLQRLTLIGKRELTQQRAAIVDQMVKDGDVEGVRRAIRQYDQLAANFVAGDLADEELLVRVGAWLDNTLKSDALTDEIPASALNTMPQSVRDNAARMAREGEYSYAYKPKDPWRPTFDDETGALKEVRPWVDLVDNIAAADESSGNWLKARGNAIHRQISFERIAIDARNSFRRAAREITLQGSGEAISQETANRLWQVTMNVARDAGVAPRGLMPADLARIIDETKGLAATGMTPRDLQMLILQSFEGRLSSVGATQKMSGMLKRQAARPTGSNMLGVLAEKIYPLVRFQWNPFFQFQEFLEPLFFLGARGRTVGLLRLSDRERREFTLLQDAVEKFVGETPEAQFDMIEKSQYVMYGGRAARNAVGTEGALTAQADQIRSGLGALVRGGPGGLKERARARHTLDFWGEMFHERVEPQFPGLWAALESKYGTTNKGTIALRFLTEQGALEAGDGRYAKWLGTAASDVAVGARGAVDLDDLAHALSDTAAGVPLTPTGVISKESLILKVKNGSLTRETFRENLLGRGATDDYADRAWGVLEFEGHRGGVDGYWDDLKKVAGADAVRSQRPLVQAMAASEGITEAEALARMTYANPMRMLHDDLASAVDAVEDTEALVYMLDSTTERAANAKAATKRAEGWRGSDVDRGLPSVYYTYDEDSGEVIRHAMTQEQAEARWLEMARKPPSRMGGPAMKPFEDELAAAQEALIDARKTGDHDDEVNAGRRVFNAKNAHRKATIEHVGDIYNIEKVPFGTRDLFIPGGVKALEDLDKPFTLWEANLLRTQLINPNDLSGPHLQGLYTKMWKMHNVDMTLEENLPNLYNNLAFAMLSPNLNLTRNEIIGTRLRVKGKEGISDLADTHDDILRTIQSQDSNYVLDESDLGFYHQTGERIRGYIPLDSFDNITDDFLKNADGTPTVMALRESRERANQYLQEGWQPHHNDDWPFSEWVVDRLRAGEDLNDIRVSLGMARSQTTGRQALAAYEDVMTRIKTGQRVSAKEQGQLRSLLGTKKLDGSVAIKRHNINGAGLEGQNLGKPVFAYLKNPKVVWRGSSTNSQVGRLLVVAKDMRENPAAFLRRPGEAADEYAERLSARVKGLGMKTSYFTVDLGDPLTFNRGVMDRQMVGRLNALMWERAKGDVNSPIWRDHLDNLGGGAKGQRAKAEKWVEDGTPDIGDYGFDDAPPRELTIGFVKGVDPNSVTSKANQVRKRAEAVIADAEARERFYRMYPTDEDLADLYLKTVPVYDGEYKYFDGLLAELQAEKAVAEPWLAGIGRGAFQWYEWDAYRNIFDPEMTVATAAHGLDPLELRHMAMSDDIHGHAGYLAAGGLPSMTSGDIGAASYLDPNATLLTQAEMTPGSGRIIRGATQLDGEGRSAMVFTEHKNRTTALHEGVHSFIEPRLDESGRMVMVDDFNRVVTERTAAAEEAAKVAKREITRTRKALTRQSGVQQGLDATVTASKAKQVRATKVVGTKERSLTSAKSSLRDSQTRLAEAKKTAARESKVLAATKDLPPSRRAARQAGIDGRLRKAEKAVASSEAKVAKGETGLKAAKTREATAQRNLDTATERAKVQQPKTDEAIAANEAAEAAATAAAEEAAAIPASKARWDRELSEYTADQFMVYLATGKAPSAKLRDFFAHMRKMMLAAWDYIKKNPDARVSPEVKSLFDDLLKSERKAKTVGPDGALMKDGYAVPYDRTQEQVMQTAVQTLRSASDAAHTMVQFRRNRSWLERSINHPYMGIYPASYMWGKVLPEMARFLAVEPFGIPAGPVGLVAAMKVQASVEMQRANDPTFKKDMDTQMQNKGVRAVSMLIPSTPFESPAQFPLFARRFAEWGLESRAREEEGKAPKTFNLPQVGTDVLTYAFGPAQSIKTAGDFVSLIPGVDLKFGGPDEDATGEVGQVLRFGEGAFAPQPGFEQRLGGAQQTLQEDIFGPLTQ